MKVLFIAIGIIIAAALFASCGCSLGWGTPATPPPMPCGVSPGGKTAPCGEKPSCVSAPPSPPGFPPAGYPSSTISGASTAAVSYRRPFPPRHWPTAGIIPTSSGCAAAWPAWGSPRIILSASFPPMTPPSAACRAKSAAAAARRTLMFPPPWAG